MFLVCFFVFAAGVLVPKRSFSLFLLKILLSCATFFRDSTFISAVLQALNCKKCAILVQIMYFLAHGQMRRHKNVIEPFLNIRFSRMERMELNN